MVPTVAELVEWALTFPLALLTFFYGQPRSPLTIVIYYILVVGNAFVLSWLIRKIFGGGSKRSD
jgi:CHASE2 domain-containing sensor protein